MNKDAASVIRKFAMGFPWETMDPFLFCVHHLDRYPEGNSEMGPAASLDGRNLGNDFEGRDGWSMYHGHNIPGFPYHPHRGFETITIVNQGYCDHSDSLGAAGRFGEGDVQWMTAGRGVQHSEMFPLLRTDARNTLELFQIWLNLPGAAKMAEPHFKMLWHEEIPTVHAGGVQVKVVCGTYGNTHGPSPAPDSWAADPKNGVAIWEIRMDKGTEIILPAAAMADVNRALYCYAGTGVQVDRTALDQGLAVQVDAGMDVPIRNANGNARFLLLQGKPIGEPVAKYGPFVMNTQQEIQQAMEEYRLTKFGGWPWPYPDQVHARTEGRFALYPDGTRVDKGNILL